MTTVRVRTPASGHRTVLHAWGEVRGLLGGHAGAHREVALTTDDGTNLAATLLPGPGGDPPAAVLLHGFAAHRRKPAYAWLADELATRCTVLTIDLRGHGRSGGSSGLGATEWRDVATAVAWLRARGHRWIALVGVSMGATAATNAIHRGVEVDALVTVSGPARIELEPRSVPMRRLRTVWRTPGGRTALRTVTGVRVDDHRGWTPPIDPFEAVRGLRAPLLVVHGADDGWFAPWHGDAIAAAVPGAVQWRPTPFGHAEDGLVDPFGRHLATALLTAQRTGTFPPRQELLW